MISQNVRKAIESINAGITTQFRVRGRMSMEDIKAVAEMLRTNTSVTELIVEWENHLLNDAEIIMIIDALKSNRSVTHVNFCGAKIRDTAAKAIADVLKVNTSIVYLNLKDNQLQEEGAIAIAEALKTNQSLAELNLCENRIDYYEGKGAEAIAEALKVNKSLTYLNLEGNDLYDKAIVVIVEALKVNRSLAHLKLGQNRTNVDPDRKVKTIKEMAEILKTNGSITHLDLHAINIEDEGAKALAEAMKVNRSIVSLNLYANWSISEVGVKAIAQALKVNRSVAELNLHFNINGEGLKAIAAALKTNQTLISIQVWPCPSLHDHQSESECASSLKEIKSYLCRNRAIDLQSLLLKNVMNQSAKRILKCTDIHTKHMYFDLDLVYQRFLARFKEISDFEDKYRDATVSRNHLNHLYAHALLFHLRCIDTEKDVSPVDDIHPAVKRAQAMLELIIQYKTNENDNTDYYAQGCFQLARYYFCRANDYYAANQRHVAYPFYDKAMEYISVCLADPNFMEEEALAHETETMALFFLFCMPDRILNKYIDKDLKAGLKFSVLMSDMELTPYNLYMVMINRIVDKIRDKQRKSAVPSPENNHQIIWEEILKQEMVNSIAVTYQVAKKTAEKYRKIRTNEDVNNAIKEFDTFLKKRKNEIKHRSIRYNFHANDAFLLQKIADLRKEIQSKEVQRIRDCLQPMKGTVIEKCLNQFIAKGKIDAIADKEVKSLDEWIDVLNNTLEQAALNVRKLS